MNKWAYISFAMMWLSVAIAISVGIYITHEWKCLFFLILPSLYDLKSKEVEDGNDQ